jgi:hypothetical protein
MNFDVLVLRLTGQRLGLAEPCKILLRSLPCLAIQVLIGKGVREYSMEASIIMWLKS